MNWYVLYVKPRNEKKVSLQLEALGLTVYCPMVVQIKQWSDRKKKVASPLISSYVFVKLEEKQRSIVFQVSGIVRYVFWLNKPAIVYDREIDLLKDSLKETMAEVEVTQLRSGDLIAISSGPFKGKQGVVQEINRNSVQLILMDLGLKIRLTKA